MFKIKNKIIYFLSLFLLIPQITVASNLVVSTIKNVDPYSNNTSWFRYTETPGGIIHDSVILRNIGDETEKIKLYATDATSNQAGSFVAKLQNEPQKSLGLWTELEKSEVILEPNQTAEVSFTIRIPDTATPGEYFGSLIKEDLEEEFCPPPAEPSTPSSCNSSIKIKTRTGNRIYLTIPGEQKADIKLSNFQTINSSAQTIFKFSFINKGNISFEPQVTISIFDLWGRKIESFNNIVGISLPGTTIEPQLKWSHGNNFGNFTAKVEINYLQQNLGMMNGIHGAAQGEKINLNIFIFPWMGFLISLALILIISTLIYLQKKYHRSILANCSDYSIEEDENILDLEAKTEIPWTVIAKINKLSPPYILHKGQIIKLPSKKQK